MKYLFWSILIFIAFLLQDRISLFGISPNLSILLTYYAGIRYGATKGLLFGALIGALEDSITLTILGPNLLSKGIAGYAAPFIISGRYFRWTPLFGIISVSLLTLIDNSLVFLSRALFDTIPATVPTLLIMSAKQSLLNAPAGILIRPDHAD